MNKKGSVLLIIGIIFLVLILIVVGVVVYLYNFYVFKTVIVCVENDANNTMIFCSSNEECIEITNGDISNPELENVPDFIKEKIEQVFETSIFCDGTCRVKQVRGFENGDIQEINSCNSDEQEIKFEIRGKEGLGILSWFREQGQI